MNARCWPATVTFVLIAVLCATKVRGDVRTTPGVCLSGIASDGNDCQDTGRLAAARVLNARGYRQTYRRVRHAERADSSRLDALEQRQRETERRLVSDRSERASRLDERRIERVEIRSDRSVERQRMDREVLS